MTSGEVLPEALDMNVISRQDALPTIQHARSTRPDEEPVSARRRYFFFGAMTPEEWAQFSYVHLDHHLRQFGV